MNTTNYNYCTDGVVRLYIHKDVIDKTIAIVIMPDLLPSLVIF